MNPVQYLIMNKSVKMSPGKLAAQAAHASQQGLRLNAKTEWGNPYDSSIVNRWMLGGHYAKVVLEAQDLVVAKAYLFDRGFPSSTIIDEGRTEVDPMTLTALGCPVLDKDNPHVRETFSTFRLYNVVPTSELLVLDRAVTPAQYAKIQEYAALGWDGARIKSWMFSECPQRQRLFNRKIEEPAKRHWWNRNLV